MVTKAAKTGGQPAVTATVNGRRARPRQMILANWFPHQSDALPAPCRFATLMILQSAGFCRFCHHQARQNFDYTPRHQDDQGGPRPDEVWRSRSMRLRSRDWAIIDGEVNSAACDQFIACDAKDGRWASIVPTTFAPLFCLLTMHLPPLIAALPIFLPPILPIESRILILLCCPSDQCTSERARSVKIIRR
jgi:hypothetical protein